MENKIFMIIDPLYGDSGKGKIAAVYSFKKMAGLAVEFGTGHSAAHEVVDDNGVGYISSVIPPCFLSPKTKLAISGNVLIDPRLFKREIISLSKFNVKKRLYIDSQCKFINYNDEDMLSVEKRERNIVENTALPKIIKDNICCRLNVPDLIKKEKKESNIIVVMQHGTMISEIYGKGKVVPYSCSSKNAIQSLELKSAESIVMVVKMMPTRILDGPLPYEIEWPHYLAPTFGKWSKKKRRIASHPDLNALSKMVKINNGTEIALTFCDYFDPNVKNVSRYGEISEKIKSVIKLIETKMNLPISYLSTGPSINSGVWLNN